MDLTKELVWSQEERPYTHLAPRKIAKKTRISLSSVRKIVKKETLNSSNAWKHQKWMKGRETEEKLALAPLEKEKKVTAVLS